MLKLLFAGTFCAMIGLNAAEMHLPPQENRWKAENMIAPAKITEPQYRVSNGEDFFRLEYGRAGTFDLDWIKEHGWLEKGTYRMNDGRMIIKNNGEGLVFGIGSAPKNNEPNVAFGINWGRALKDDLLMEMDVSQNLDKSEWLFEAIGRNNRPSMQKKFIITGKERQDCKVNLGWIRKLTASGGIRLTCLTSGAEASIGKIEFRPFTVKAYWRKSFELKEKPLFAHASFQAFETYELRINGQVVSVGADVYPAPIIRHADITQFLKAGTNEILMVNDCAGWTRTRAEWLFEAAAIGVKGELTRILSGGDWECSLDGQTWMKPKTEKRQMMTYLSNRKDVFSGLNPRHMGILQPRPGAGQYPLFEYDRDITYTVKIPAGMPGALEIGMAAESYPEAQAVGEGSAGAPRRDGEWLCYDFKLPSLIPGPYRLKWTLRQGDKVIDETVTQCVVIGPIEQDSVAPEKLGQKLESRLELIRSIDCTKPGKPGEFVDHAGMYRPLKQNLGKVVEKDGMKYRTAGENFCDYFAYSIDVFKEKGPVLVEILVPDNENRLIYSAVCENYPIRFTNNQSNTRLASTVATGSMITGLDTPLTGKLVKLRYLYYPGSSEAAVFVMNGFRDAPAAAAQINLYRIKGGLPQVAAADSGRLFGPYTERLSNTNDTFGTQYNVLLTALNYLGMGMENAWLDNYRMYADKIRFLRYTGQNLSGEGVYMYAGGCYPSEKHSNYPHIDEIDPLLLALKMYNHNGIKAQIGVQYTGSPQIAAHPGRVSDRRMRQGAETMWMVDRKGRQSSGVQNTGASFLHPAPRADINAVVKEIYERYKDEKAVSGMFLMSGYLMAPGFQTAYHRELDDHEVGYGDYTIGLFEKETGIKLGVDPASADRFDRRYQALTGKYAAKWHAWRAAKMAEYLRELRGITANWPLFVYPYPSYMRGREGSISERLKRIGYDPKLYDGKDITLIAKLLFYVHISAPSDESGFIYGWNCAADMRELIKGQGAAFLASPHSFFQEIDFPGQGAKEWIFSGTKRGVFVPRRSGDNMLAELVDVLAVSEPRLLYSMWLDCNFDTNINPAMARFAAAFRAIPPAEFTPYAKVKGGNPRLGLWQGKYYLRLTNNTPYPLGGSVDGKSCKLAPCEMVTLNVKSSQVTGELRFAQADEEKIAALGSAFADDENIPEKLRQSLEKYLADKDYFNTALLFKEPQLHDSITRAAMIAEAVKMQKLFADELSKGRVRINCGYSKLWTAPDGSRWLPDQTFHSWKSYGNVRAHFVDRGEDLKIDGSDLQRVYSTESYGAVVSYLFPVPNADYQVKLHFAETHELNKRPDARKITVEIQGTTLPKTVDPYADAGGFAKPYILTVDAVKVEDGKLQIRLIRDVGIQGIEIIQKGK